MRRHYLILYLIPLCLVPAVGAAELKHLWDFEGDEWWLDKAGQAHGTVTATTTLTTAAGAGEVGTAMQIQTSVGGPDDFLQLDSSELFVPGVEAFSVVFWVRMPDDGTTDPRGIIDFSGDGGDGIQSLYIGNSGELAFRVDVPGGAFSLAKITADLEDDAWHFVAATYDPVAGLEVHLDGFGVDGAASASAGSVPVNSISYLGSFNYITTQPAQSKGLGGRIDDLAIYSGVLTEAEITGLNDNVVAGADGGEFSFDVSEPRPRRLFLQVRKGAG